MMVRGCGKFEYGRVLTKVNSWFFRRTISYANVPIINKI